MITSMEFINRHINCIKYHLKTPDEKNRKEAEDHAKAIRTIRLDLTESFFSHGIDFLCVIHVILI